MRASELSNELDQATHLGPIGGALPDVMNSHDTLPIDKDVTASLVHILSSRLQFLAGEKGFPVSNPCGRPPQVPEPGLEHPVRLVETPLTVDKKGPWETRLLDVCPRHAPGLERDDDHAQTQFIQDVLLLPQLREVISARQSAKVSMEHHEQPLAVVALEAVIALVEIAKRERNGLFAREIRASCKGLKRCPASHMLSTV